MGPKKLERATGNMHEGRCLHIIHRRLPGQFYIQEFVAFLPPSKMFNAQHLRLAFLYKKQMKGRHPPAGAATWIVLWPARTVLYAILALPYHIIQIIHMYHITKVQYNVSIVHECDAMQYPVICINLIDFASSTLRWFWDCVLCLKRKLYTFVKLTL